MLVNAFLLWLLVLVKIEFTVLKKIELFVVESQLKKGLLYLCIVYRNGKHDKFILNENKWQKR